MTLRAALICVFVAAAIQTVLAANCAPVTLNSVTPNYFPLYYKSPSTPSVITSPPLQLSVTNAYQPIGTGGALSILYDL
jgi:hypothetical protein